MLKHFSRWKTFLAIGLVFLAHAGLGPLYFMQISSSVLTARVGVIFVFCAYAWILYHSTILRPHPIVLRVIVVLIISSILTVMSTACLIGVLINSPFPFRHDL